MSKENLDWWRGAVIFEVYLRSFMDGNGDGVGDFSGLIEKLPYIKDLGVDAIWISPFFCSPMKDFGYDISDYCGVDPIFGTLQEFDKMIGLAHSLGLKVIIDQVWGHTSDKHPWFQDSRRQKNSDKTDWYIWADSKPDGTPPNNWLAVFGGSAWSWEPRRHQYYLHHFLPSQPKLNLRDERVLEALFETMKFWLQRGVDGFRFDAVDFMFHDLSLRNNPAAQLDGRVPVRPFRMQKHLYDMFQEDTTHLLERLRAFLKPYPGVTLLGEISSEIGSFERIAKFTSVAGKRLHMAYTLGVMKRDFSSQLIHDLIEQALSNEGGWICWSFSNHDVVRVATRWHPEKKSEDSFSKLLLALLFFLKGSVCLYQGEELGLHQADLAFEDLQDPYGINYYPEFPGRDGSRTPIPWTNSRNGGFTKAPKPWLPIPKTHLEKAVDIQSGDPDSCLNATKALLAWRKQNPALQFGELRIHSLGEPFLIVREHLGKKALGLFNLTNEKLTQTISGLPHHQTKEISGFNLQIENDTIILPPYGAYFGGMT